MKARSESLGSLSYMIPNSRRILGLAPEILTPKSPPPIIEEKAPISFPKSTYAHIDLTGMEEPVHANGFTG